MTTLRIFKHYIRVPYIMLGALEFIVFVLSVKFGTDIRASEILDLPVGPETASWTQKLAFAGMMSLSMVALGLYQARLRDGGLGFLLRLSASYLIGVVGLAVLFYIFPSLFLRRTVLVFAIVISVISIILIRLFVYNIDPEIFKRRILVLGAGKNAKAIAELRRKSDQLGFTVVGYIHIRGEDDQVDPKKIINLNTSVKDYALNNDIDEIVLAVGERRKGFPMRDLLDCKMNGVDVVDMLGFYERETGKIRLDQLHPSWMVFSDGFTQSAFRVYMKRVFDILTSLILLVFSFPIIIIAMLAILIESRFRGPVIYRQIRIGEDGKPFQMLKLRSMHIDAEKDGLAQWAEKNDVRITRVGKFIRKTRIDELPQVINVLRGDMSFVGPRCERPHFVMQLSESIPYYEERHRVKPGITGWAQLRYPYGSSVQDAAEKLQYDLYYVKNYSLFLDILIMIESAEVVLFGKGAR
ncbi:MAG: TIGR03013 family PEP-CTERM/XrtA system glycosyltransferase [Gammaproteobacteria bacterium]|nr:TIGR03013 family PEP-CTERM/XrtA system glycosyltransferase [Gammaproteobacteria bacterium]MDH5778682.1 TIGR03013 family PEP-CTERM/XrtA system glycosyltransferase [Gammaproteobacteria bacterium]